jgi:hypothetical protein
MALIFYLKLYFSVSNHPAPTFLYFSRYRTIYLGLNVTQLCIQNNREISMFVEEYNVNIQYGSTKEFSVTSVA